MRRSLLLAGAVALAFAAATLNNACSGDDTSSGSPDADTSEASTSICDRYTGAGKPCSPVSDQRCFPLCAVGGSFCRAAPNGNGGVWVFVDDESCMPEGGGIDLDSSTPDMDTGVTTDDGSTQDASDAGTSSDTGSDASDSGMLDADDSG
jgi:hypothetical protein